MDSILKQRLVGALILLALAVVFWPIIFVPPTQRSDDVRVAAPPPPTLSSAPLPEPDDLGLAPVKEPELQALDDRDVLLPGTSSGVETPELAPRDAVLPVAGLAAAREQLKAPELDEDGLPLAYSLQVATVSESERAQALRDELVAAGYKGYIKRMRRDKAVLYRVLVGPRFSRDELLPIKAAVDARWNVESLIMRYLP